MKHTLGMLALLVGLLAANNTHACDSDNNTGVYVGGFGGANWVSNNSVDLDTGWATAGAVGYKFETGTRVEGEVSYHRNGLKGSSAHLSNTAVMVNAFQDIYVSALPFTPYIGAGVGHTWGKASASAGPVSASVKDDGFAWQAMAGGTITVADKTELGVEYRMLQSAEKTYNHGVGVTVRRFF